MMKKEYVVKLSRWEEGKGWRYTTTIDNCKEPVTAAEYADGWMEYEDDEKIREDLACGNDYLFEVFCEEERLSEAWLSEIL